MSVLNPQRAATSSSASPVMVLGTAWLLATQAADLATFALVTRFVALDYEINPLARFAYGQAGLVGLLALKAVFCLYIIWAIAVATSGWGRIAIFALAIGIGLAGTAANVWSLENFWSARTVIVTGATLPF